MRWNCEFRGSSWLFTVRIEPLLDDPVGSATAWATLLTGQGAHVHGVLSDMVATGDSEGMRPVAMTDRAVPVVWEAAESAGIRALAVAPCWPRCSCGNWGTSRPARPPCARRRGSCVRSGRVAAPLGPGAASGLRVRVDDANYMISVPGAGFKPVEFDGMRKQAVPKSFTLMPSSASTRAG